MKLKDKMDYEKVRELVDQLHRLFAHPEPGLFTWNIFLFRKLEALAKELVEP